MFVENNNVKCVIYNCESWKKKRKSSKTIVGKMEKFDRNINQNQGPITSKTNQ